jgi:hypothetical protein
MRGIQVSTVVISAAMAALAGMPHALATDAPSVLTGGGHGRFHVRPNNLPDTGTQRIVRGHGHFSIGAAKIRGVVSAPGFVREGSCGVSLRLATDTGTLKIVGHSQVRSRDGDQPICDGHDFRFRFHTANARGALAEADYRGVGILDLEDASNEAVDRGTFKVLLRVPRD